MGKRLTSVTGFTDLAISTFFTYLGTAGSTEWQDNMVARIEAANAYASDDDWKRVGEPIGKLAAQLLQYDIPQYDNSYSNYTVNG
jgi:hypothetical protein